MVVGHVLGQEQRHQVGVPLELDAEHLRRLPLVPVGPPPDGGHGGDAGLLLGDAGFDGDAVLVGVGVELVDDLQPLLSVIDAGEAAQVLEVEAGVFLGRPQDAGDILPRYHEDNVQGTLGGVEGDVGQRLFERIGYGARGKGLRRHVRRLIMGIAHPIAFRSAMTLFWRAMRPSMRASGRGGQPGT